MTNETNPDPLREFFAAYFHEDWRAEASGPDQVVEDFLALDWEPSKLRALQQGLISYVEERENDAKLEADLFSELGCYYAPQNAGVPARAWLLQLASTFGAAAKVAAG